MRGLLTALKRHTGVVYPVITQPKSMMGSSPGGLASPAFTGFLGGNNNASEFTTQMHATEDMTFSQLRGKIISGGSGANTYAFRKGAVTQSLSATKSGTGDFIDSSNSVACVAGDTINVRESDNGTDPNTRTMCINCAFASGFGKMHGSGQWNASSGTPNGITNYYKLAANYFVTGDPTIANNQWKNRGYTSIEALQVRVTANARTTATTLQLNVNGVDVGSVLTIAAAQTGLIKIVGQGIRLVDGDLVTVKVSFGVEANSISISAVWATFKSLYGKHDLLTGSGLGFARTASATATYYAVDGSVAGDTTEANNQTFTGFNCKAKNLRAHISANTYTGSCTIALMRNGSPVITITVTAGQTGWVEESATEVSIADTDLIDYRIVNGTANSMTVDLLGVTLGQP